MKRLPVIVYILLGLGLLVALKFIFFPKKDQPKGLPKGGKSAAPVTANFFVAREAEVSSDVFTTGKAGALNSVELVSEIPGKILAIHFREGQEVSKGQLLVKINDADLQAQYEKNRIQLKLAEQKLERLKKLLAINGISQEEFDVQENEVAALNADAAFIRAQIAKTNIIAPFSGVVGLKNVSEGAFVSPSQPVVSLVQTKPVYIEFSLPEKYAQHIREGAVIRFSNEHNGAKTHTAAVYALEPRIDEATRTLKGRALYQGNERFLPNTFVKVYANLTGGTRSIMIPSQSIVPVLKGQKVFVSRNGTAQEVMVQTGMRSEDMVQILDGLSAGDTVLTSGLMTMKQGSKLKLKGESN